MEAAGEAESILGKIKPPRLEDAGLEDCALPPESIKEAFLRAASAVRSIVSDSDDDGDGRCVEGTWEDSSDALIGITEGVNGPSEGCVVEKGGGLTEAPGDKVAVGGGESEEKVDTVVGPGVPASGEEACVDGLRGLEIGEKSGGILGKKLVEGKNDVADGDEGDKEKPILVEGHGV